MKKLLSVISSLVLISAAFGQAATSHVGLWRGGLSNSSLGGSFADLHLSETGTFRWFMVIAPEAGEIRTIDSKGRYQITENRLELFYSDRPETAQTWSFTIEGDTFLLIDKHGSERIPYKRIVDKKATEPGLLPPLTPSKMTPETPGDAARMYYETLNSGDSVALEKLMSSERLAKESSLSPQIKEMRRGMYAVFAGKVARIEVLKENIQDKRAWVNVRVHFTNGRSEQFNCGLKLEDGVWKTSGE